MRTLLLYFILVFSAAPAFAQQTQKEKPFVKGGAFDKPYLFKSELGKTALGGYAETHFRFEREDGITEEITFVPKRFNLFFHSNVSDRFRMAAELEFEEGTEEILLELAILDFEIHYALNFRAGMLLTPLGKFNLAHDSPANKLTDRPLVSTEIIPTALSEAGMGFFGSVYPTLRSRFTYELYLTNGFTADIVEESPDGTRIAEGRGNVEDNNNRPAFAGRLALSPIVEAEVGFSWHHGQYNVSEVEGLEIDDARYLSIFAFDWEFRKDKYEFLGEYARSSLDIDPGVKGTIFAENQQGVYLQGSADFLNGLFTALPESYFSGILRYGIVDFDSDIDGDSQKRLTLGLNFRPTSDSVFKLDYQFNWLKDRFNAEATSAAILFSVATYF